MTGPTFAPPTPAARTAAAPAAPPRPAARAVAEPNGFPVLTWLRLHWLTILFCGTLLGGTLAYLAWTLLPSEYESYALLRVASSPFSVANQKDPNRTKTDFATYLKTNAQLIKYEFVLNAALNRPLSGKKEDTTGPRIADLPTLKAQPEPIKYLDEKLLVTTSEGSEIVRLSMKGHNPGDVQKIVNAVLAAYMDEVVEKETTKKAEFLGKVEATLARMTEQLNTKIGPGEQPGAKKDGPHAVPAATPGGMPERAKKAMEQLLITTIATQRRLVEELPLTMQSQKARLESLQKQLDALKQGPIGKDILEAVEADPDVRELAAKGQYFRRKYEHDSATYANPAAPSVQASRVQAELAEAELKKLRETKARDRESARRQSKADELFKQFDEASRVHNQTQEQYRVVKFNLEANEKKMAELPPDPVTETVKKEAEKKGPVVSTDVSRLLAEDDVFRSLSQHAAVLRLDQESPERVTPLQPASNPMQKDGKKQILATVFAGLLGFALIGFAAVGYEVKVKKVSTLAEVKTATPTPVVGVLPWQPAGRPVSEAAVMEAVDKLRGYVAQTWLARGATTVAVTSALADEGKAVTAFRLAGSLAAAGYKTLLVDFDLRSPALHTLAGVQNEAGVCELLRGDADFRGTIRQLPGGPLFLSAGAWSDEARQAAVGGRLESLLARLREPFDCVIVHAHSLLTAAESIEVARRCEVVLLCALGRDTRTPLLKRATERVATMEIPYSGVVYLGATPEESLC